MSQKENDNTSMFANRLDDTPANLLRQHSSIFTLDANKQLVRDILAVCDQHKSLLKGDNAMMFNKLFNVSQQAVKHNRRDLATKALKSLLKIVTTARDKGDLAEAIMAGEVSLADIHNQLPSNLDDGMSVTPKPSWINV